MFCVWVHWTAHLICWGAKGQRIASCHLVATGRLNRAKTSTFRSSHLISRTPERCIFLFNNKQRVYILLLACIRTMELYKSFIFTYLFSHTRVSCESRKLKECRGSETSSSSLDARTCPIATTWYTTLASHLASGLPRRLCEALCCGRRSCRAAEDGPFEHPCDRGRMGRECP